MKKVILVAVLAVSCLFMNAQEGLQGTWFVGGNLSLGSVKTFDDDGDEIKTDTYGVMPMIGTFISPSVAVGAALGYNHSKVSILDEDATKVNAFTIQPFVRKYWNISGGLHFFGQMALPVEFGTLKYGDDDDFKVNTTSINFALSPGFDYIINSWISVETAFTLFTAGYGSVKPKGGDSVNSWAVNGNSHGNKIGDLTIGVKFLF